MPSKVKIEIGHNLSPNTQKDFRFHECTEEILIDVQLEYEYHRIRVTLD